MRHGGGHVGLRAAAGLVCLAAACSRAFQPADPAPAASAHTDAGPSAPLKADVLASESPSPSPANNDASRILHGWFTIVWNDQAHAFLTDDAGDTHELLLDDDLIGPMGGLMALDRKRVVITAEASTDRPGVLRVTSIAIEVGG